MGGDLGGMVRRSVVGVDGSPDGWVAVELRDGAIARAESHPTLAAVLIDWSGAAAVGVDMPIGTPAVDSWPRRADLAARVYLGIRRSSVFMVPPIEALQAPSHAEAVQRLRDAGLPGVSQQAFALRHKIFEVARVAADSDRLFEVHPEVSFAAMTGVPLAHAKRTWNGYHERRRALAAVGIAVPDDLGDLGGANVDDVLDATAAAWSASRIAEGSARCLPADAKPGEPRIWY